MDKDQNFYFMEMNTRLQVRITCTKCCIFMFSTDSYTISVQTKTLDTDSE